MISIVVSSFVAFAVHVASSHSTVAPSASNIALSGTIVLPSISCGGTSNAIGAPSRFTVITLPSSSANAAKVNTVQAIRRATRAVLMIFFIIILLY